MPWIAPLIAGIVSVGTTVGSTVAAKRQQDRQNEANAKLTNLNNQLQVDLINKQNEYNSPSAQMERYRQAGINPYVAANNAGNQSGIASTQAPQQSYSNYMDRIQNVANLVNQLQQVQLNEENAKNLASVTQLNKAKADVEQEKLNDWRFRNLFGMSNAENRAALLALQQGKLYYDLKYEYGQDSVLHSADIDTPYGSQSFFTPRRLSFADLMNGYRNKRDESNLQYQKSGTDLRKLTYEWDSANREYGIGPRAPYWLSFARFALDKIREKFHF